MKVSICVRVKYPVEYLHAMLLCLRRQTHEDWEAIIVTDGPNTSARELVASFNDPRMVFIETPEPLGFWGHPYRNLAIQQCTGDLIGLTNDDNYYVPGYFAEMIKGMQHLNHRMVMCDMLHKDFNWAICDCQPIMTECDLGNWLVEAAVAKSIPWPGNDVADDGRYVVMLAKAVGRIAKVKKPLFIKN